MMFGRTLRLPIDTEIDAPTTARSRSAAAYIDELRDGLRNAYREAIQLSDVRHELNKRLYERKLNAFHYSVGDSYAFQRGGRERRVSQICQTVETSCDCRQAG